MTRNRRLHSFVAMATLIAGSAAAFAHDGIEHVMGTVQAVSSTSITVETVKHEMSVIVLDPSTTFTNRGAKAAAMDVKVGDRVAINAKDDAHEKLHAISVKWGTTTPVKGGVHKTDTKKKM